MTEITPTLPESQLGPAERLLDLVLNSSAHLWHNRRGLNVNGRWLPNNARTRRRHGGEPVQPGLFVPAAVQLYGQLLEIYQLNAELMAHFASYALVETEWRDLKVACAALMLVQTRHGEPVPEEDGSVAFYDDDYRAVGEALLLHYARGSRTMLNPKGVLRVAQLLEVPEIAALNRRAGFADAAGRKPPLGRWKSAARQWLRFRERNVPLLQGLVKAGFKETIKRIARKAGYKPDSQLFFELLGWRQKQSDQGHRSVGMGELTLHTRERFDGLSEEEICARVVEQKLSYKDVVGRLPADVGLTAAIMAACLPSLSDRDLRQLTPTLESLGLLEDDAIKARWDQAIQSATDQRALNIAKNVQNLELRQQLEQAADHAVRNAVEEAAADLDLQVMFLIDKSGSMTGAIEQSKEAISRILAGFPAERLHVACFDTMGTVLRPKAPTRAGVQHMLRAITAGGGTVHGSAVRALQRAGVRIPASSGLIVIVIGDEAGEDGATFAGAFRQAGYAVSAIAFILCSGYRGSTVRDCARELAVPYAEIQVDQFEDPYQVPRVLQTILEAPAAGGPRQPVWVEKVMSTPLLTKPAMA